MAKTMEELLASQDKKVNNLFRGQQIEGEIVSLSDKEIILDIGAKSEGILQRRELSDEQSKNLKVGDNLKVFVSLVENEHGQAVLSTSFQVKSLGGFMGKSRGPAWNKFIQAQNQKTKLQGKVLEVNKGGLIVEVEGTRGFLPNSQVGFELLSKTGSGMENLIGQNLSVCAIEVDQNNNKLIFSQRGQVSDEVKSKLTGFKKDQKVLGKIVAILPFGLVVSVRDRSASGGDVLGVEGLVFISDVSWETVDDLLTLYKTGDEIEVLIIGSDADLGRLNLSVKQLSEDPFKKLSEKYPADEVVKAEVKDVSEDGVIVKLDGGIEGFLPASKVGSTKYEAGKIATLLVDSIDSKRRRINLAPFVTTTSGLIYK